MEPCEILPVKAVTAEGLQDAEGLALPGPGNCAGGWAGP